MKNLLTSFLIKTRLQQRVCD